jgi:hypothetical protein
LTTRRKLTRKVNLNESATHIAVATKYSIRKNQIPSPRVFFRGSIPSERGDSTAGRDWRRQQRQRSVAYFVSLEDCSQLIWV